MKLLRVPGDHRCLVCETECEYGRPYVLLTDQEPLVDARSGVIVSCSEHELEACLLTREAMEPEEGLEILQYTEGMVQPIKDTWMDAVRSAMDLMYKSNEEIEELLDKEEKEEISQSQAGEESAS